MKTLLYGIICNPAMTRTARLRSLAMDINSAEPVRVKGNSLPSKSQVFAALTHSSHVLPVYC